MRATDWAAPARAPLNCAPREETKKKKRTQHNKTLPKRGGFKRLRKPPTVKLCTGAQSNRLQTCTCSSLRRPGTTQVRFQHALLSPTTVPPGTPPCRQLHVAGLCPFLVNGPKGYPDNGRLVCHREEEAVRMPRNALPLPHKTAAFGHLPAAWTPLRQATR